MEMSELEINLAMERFKEQLKTRDRRIFQASMGDHFLITGKPEVERIKEVLTIADKSDSKECKDIAIKLSLQFFTKLIESND